MIQDQYEEEYFISFLRAKSNEIGSQNSSQNSTVSGNAAPLASDGLVYKYYSELSNDEI